MPRSNGAAFAELQRWRQRIVELGDVATTVAPAVADELSRVLAAQIAAGLAPDGSAWPLRQDGEKALQTAADRLEVKSVGSVVLAILRGPTVLHNYGRAAGKIVRQVLPSSSVPAAMIEALRRVVIRRAEAVIKGGG